MCGAGSSASVNCDSPTEGVMKIQPREGAASCHRCLLRFRVSSRLGKAQGCTAWPLGQRDLCTGRLLAHSWVAERDL